jgi:hypothetical protein
MTSYAPTQRNVDHTKSVALRASNFSKPTYFSLLLLQHTDTVAVQVRGRACDQYPEGNEYRGDCAKTEACSELHCVHMGSQVLQCLLGRYESVSIFLLSCRVFINALREYNGPEAYSPEPTEGSCITGI